MSNLSQGVQASQHALTPEQAQLCALIQHEVERAAQEFNNRLATKDAEIEELRGQVEDQTYGGPRSAHRTSAHRQKVVGSTRHSAGCAATNSRALCKVRFKTLSEAEKATHFPASAVASCESPFLRGC